ncbi:hypothetical protein INS49_001321 [Diaporthe citri]|uniref:uncharacterized protein n=1 Tax=Diaporthe citri TaxID=83186 RepID=UPI001C7E7285|nr:uncharacterized protein INS49_001321 [Diaporthe citri]KAG6367138.1 hypothetical protein INS49_001321 [Diaporthe citri]
MAHVGGTRTYRAPEVAVISSKQVSQKYDVWSLGCVFLEFISCHLVGHDATRGSYFKGDDERNYQSFVTARLEEDFVESGILEDKYLLYKSGLEEPQVKNSVIQWFLYLHGQNNCSDALHDFWDVIQEHMLVHRPGTRWPIQEVLERLATILTQSRQDGSVTEYCHVGRPWVTSLASNFPSLWDEDEYRQRLRPHFYSQASAQANLTSSASSDGSERQSPTDSVGSKHDFGQIEDVFADETHAFSISRSKALRALGRCDWFNTTER